MLMDEREMDNMLPGDTTAGQNATEGIRRKSCSKGVIEGVRSRARVFVENLIVRMTDRMKRHGGLLSRDKNRGCHREGGTNHGSGQGRIYFSTPRH